MNVSTALKIIETECCTQISIEACHEAFADCEDLKLAPENFSAQTKRLPLAKQL